MKRLMMVTGPNGAGKTSPLQLRVEDSEIWEIMRGSAYAEI